MGTEPNSTGAISADLEGVPLFSECTNAERRKIASTGRLLQRTAGSSIVTENSRGVAFFLILAGSVDVSRDGRVIARLRPGDYFGEMALLSEHARSATATAATDVELFTFSQWNFKSMLHSNPKIAYKVLTTVADRVAADARSS